VTDPWEHEILQDGCCGRTGTDDQNACRFQGRLPCCSPKSVDMVKIQIDSKTGSG